MIINKCLKYFWILMIIASTTMTGCSNTKETVNEVYEVSEIDLEYALPKVGEAEIIKADVKAGSKGTISVATVGSPNTEILQEAGRILEEKGYLLNIEVCQDYLEPNQLLEEGKVDCNYYQHEAFLERYNIEKQTNLIEMAKIHYEPLAIFSQKTENLEQIKKGAKIAVPENPTGLAQALWLLQEEGIVVLMKDADMNTVMDDIAQNPNEVELIPMKEEEILSSMKDVDLAICHTGYALKEAVDTRDILLATEDADSMMAKKLSQSVVVKEDPNEKVQILVDVLRSDKIKQFIEKEYQGSIYIRNQENIDLEKNEEENSIKPETEELENEGEEIK